MVAYQPILNLIDSKLMSRTKVFFDSNVLLYLLSEDTDKADKAEKIINQGGIISVQVLNEFTSVARRKLKMSWAEIRETLDPIRKICQVTTLSPETYDRGLLIAERYDFSFYDSLILASALLADCPILYTEDLQDGQVIQTQLTVCNPFRHEEK